MISRIRLDAFGRTAAEVEATLYDHADEIEKLLGVPTAHGECHIERTLAVPVDTVCDWSGRLLLHPDISTQPLVVAGTNAANAKVTWTNIPPDNARNFSVT
jgi:hypothetical protein